MSKTKAFRIWFLSLKKIHQFALCVLAIHVSAILWMTIDNWIEPSHKDHHPIYVRTVHPPMAPMHIATATKGGAAGTGGSSNGSTTVSSAAVSTAPIKTQTPKPAPKEKTPTASTTASKKTTAATKPVSKQTSKSTSKPNAKLASKQISKKSSPKGKAKKTTSVAAPTLSAQTIKEIEESFSAISSEEPAHSHSQKSDIQIPTTIQTKSVVQASIESTPATGSGTGGTSGGTPGGTATDGSSEGSSYHTSLVENLQSSLQLPEMGDVRVKISIAAPGKLTSVQILDTKSAKNAEWLKNQLPLLELPCFNDYGILDAFLEFTITFRNVETF